ncbi:hypothetical protein [Bacillus sp. AFS014408]|uniref:hypothetical protein n=1 Tax=Bacillus sp. AFS014408 TaxID=2034278 RepID=UPI001596484F|nr:hypothetical protein [Bacillus sp. AFS014408]
MTLIIDNIIPIHAKKGETLEITVHFLIDESGNYGHGLQFSSEFNRNESVSEIYKDTYQLSATKTGMYYSHWLQNRR